MPDPGVEVTLEVRVATLERQVDLLRRAVGLLTVSAQPTVKWLDALWDKEPVEPDPEGHGPAGPGMG